MSRRNCIFKLEHFIKGLLCRCFSKLCIVVEKVLFFLGTIFSHVCCGLAAFCSLSHSFPFYGLCSLLIIHLSRGSWLVFPGICQSSMFPFKPLASSAQQEAERRTASAKSIAQSRRWARISVGKMIR